MLRSICIAFAIAAAALSSAPALADPSLSAVLSGSDWLNGRVREPDVRRKVVLVDFYTFDCINCKDVEPNLRSLYATRSPKDFLIISVHSPETAYERDVDHLIESTKQQGVVWPVVVDNDFTIWNACGVTAWPTQMIFDRDGTLAKTVVGEGQDDLVDRTVDALIGR